MLLNFELEKPAKIEYENHIVGEYIAYIVVDNKIIIEVKAVE